LSIVWKYITPALLDEIADKSQRQVFTIVSRFEPRIKHQDNTRPVMVRQPVEAPRERQHARALNSSCELALAASKQGGLVLGENHHRNGGKKSSTPETSTPEPEMETVKMHQVNCLVEDEVMQMLNRCKELMSGKFPTGIDYNTLMQELAAEWLKKHDPVQRAEHRENKKKQSPKKKQDAGEVSRHISPATRDAVFNRDDGQCTYVGPNGKRCESKWDLEIHHDEVPYALGGGHSLDNIRLLCAAHNKLEAERVFGFEHMKKFAKQRE
jgi:5-methylcytosine-specific restriction endonuclease McrA